MKLKLNEEKTTLNDIENQMNTLKAKFESKNLDVYSLNSKIEEKTKVLSEAKKAYAKV